MFFNCRLYEKCRSKNYRITPRHPRFVEAVLFQFSRQPQFLTAGAATEKECDVSVINSAILCELHCKINKNILFCKRMTRIYRQENHISDGGARYEDEDGSADEDSYCDRSE